MPRRPRPLLDVYYETPSGETFDGFANSEENTGTSGVEADLRAQGKAAEVVLGYAGYTSSGLNRVDYFAVPGREGPLLALPQHKVVGRGTVEFGPHLTVGPVLTWVGPRWAITSVTPAGRSAPERLPSAWLADLTVNVVDLVDGLQLSLSGHDLLDQNPAFAQAYDGWHAPLPGPGRELGVQVSFER